MQNRTSRHPNLWHYPPYSKNDRDGVSAALFDAIRDEANEPISDEAGSTIRDEK